jgi:hypothetical protein
MLHRVSPGLPITALVLGAREFFQQASPISSAGELPLRIIQFTIKPAIASPVFCAMALADIQSGDVEGAGQSMESCRQWPKSEAEMLRAEKIGKFVAARAKAAVAVRPGEKLQRAIRSTAGMECSAEGNRLLVVIGGKQTAFDLPAPDGVEFPANPRAKITFNCGPMQPVATGVEFAPPLSALATNSGIVRRLEY